MGLHRPTTFVLGAGSSNEFGMPLGGALRDQVRDLFRVLSQPDQLGGAAPLQAAIRALGQPEADILDAMAKARAAIPQFSSIDDFLHDFRDQGPIPDLCRIAIAERILAAEASSRVMHASDVNPDARGDTHQAASVTWLGILLRRLRAKLKDPGEVLKNVSFVTFNYDRCLETYLHSFVRDGFAVKPEEAALVLESTQVEHVYGSLGDLPTKLDPVQPVDFGSTRAALDVAASRIKTYGEGPAEEATAQRLRDLLRSSDQIVFLGYAFHPQGLDLLFPEPPHPDKTIQATTFKLTGEQNNSLDGLGSAIKYKFPGSCADWVGERFSTLE